MHYIEQSIERLVHFRCGACRKWWSIADAPEQDYWYCPWCGDKLPTKF
jgi:hypothetical protein